MAQEHKVPMICLILGKLCDFFHDIHTQRLVDAGLKVQAHCHRPGTVQRSFKTFFSQVVRRLFVI